MTAPARIGEAVAPEDVSGEDLDELLVRSERARSRGSYREGRRLAERVVAVVTVTGDDTRLSTALRLIANQSLRLGDIEGSARAGSQAVVVAERLRDAPAEVDALNLLAFAYMQLALYDEALAAIERSIERVGALPDRELRSGTYNRAGTIRSAMGDFAAAGELFDRARTELDTLAEGGDEVSSETMFCLLTNTADLVLETARAGEPVEPDALREGVARSDHALDLAQVAENPYRQALSHLNSGGLSVYLGDDEAARRSLDAAATISREHGYRGLEMGCLELKALHAQRRGLHTEALEVFAAVVELAEETADSGVLARAHQSASESWEAVGDFRAALESYRRFHDLETAQRTQTAEVRSRLVGMTVELQQLRSEAAELGRRAHEDSLTGLANRRSFDESLPGLLARARPEDWICVCLIDVDHFKLVNDTHGHAVGDVVLRNLGQLLREEVRRDDLLARIGGEEFALVCLLRRPADGERFGDGLRQRAAGARKRVEGYDWTSVAPGLAVTVSVGAAMSRGSDGIAAADLMVAADELLYAAKAAGRNRIRSKVLSPPTVR